MSTYISSPGIETKKVKRVNEITPIDTGLIRCICPSTEDDGFTIQCERCLVWQHAYCVHITHATIPEHYLCDQCSKRKKPKLSKRIPISKTKLQKLDSEQDPTTNKKKKHVKSRIVSRYVHPIFKEAKERWSKWKQHEGNHLLYDHGPFVTMDTTTFLTKGLLIDTPVSNGGGIFANRNIPSLRYLMQITGDILLKSEFKFNPLNDYVLLGTPSSHIMFYPTLDLCIDTRQFGNKARYIRRSCHPNAELRNVILPKDDKTIHLGLFARHLIEKGQEITISWGWQRGHIAWKENMNWHYQQKQKGNQDNQVIDEEEERIRKSTIKSMLDRFEKEFGNCACLNKRRCLIEHLKRQIIPKENNLFKLPAINILPRRKSEVILLKPKSQIKLDSTSKIKLLGEEIIDIVDSPTLNVDEDEELVDVEGDIDIGDDLPNTSITTKDNLPLLDDNSTDEENADLSSLSSLSSLSVFEESANDHSDDDENRLKLRRKKHASKRHRHHQRHHRTSSSSNHTNIENHSSNVLPRKKLWMRDYLNKGIPDEVDAQHMRQENTFLSIKHNTNYTNNDTSNVNNCMDIDTKMQLFDAANDRTLVNASPEDIEAAKLLLDAMAANEIPYIHREPNFQIQPTSNHIQPTFDIDEGELSDASTILLDQEELREAYRRRSYDAVDVAVNNVTHQVLENTNIIVMENINDSKDSTVPTDTSPINAAPIIKGKDDNDPTITSSTDASPPKVDLSSVIPTNVSPINVNLTKQSDPIEPSDLTLQTKIESTEKKPIRKISLQEYLFKQQQQKKMH